MLDAPANQFAADRQDEYGRHESHADQERDEFRAEARERQSAAPFDHQLDDVAREDEHQRHEHGEVRRRERVKDKLRGEIGREA